MVAALIAGIFLVFKGLNQWTRESGFMQAVLYLSIFVSAIVHLLRRAEFVGNLTSVIINTVALGLLGGIVSAKYM